jgi:hypothetical protein
MKHFEIRTFENEAKQVIFGRTERTGNLFADSTAQSVYFVNVPFFIDTPQGRVQLNAEITLDAKTSDEAFDTAQAQVGIKFTAARQKAIDEFVALQRAASLRMGVGS